MSTDRLQSLICQLRCPYCARISPASSRLPETHRSPEGAFLFARAIIDGVAGIFPAVKLSASPFFAFGSEGTVCYRELLDHASGRGLYVIADVPLSETGPEQAALAEAFLSHGARYPADAVTLNAYYGSDAIIPVLELCRTYDKAVFVTVRRNNRTAVELQDLIAGDRVVYKALADLAVHAGGRDRGEYGYSRVCLSFGSAFPSDVRELRRRYEHTFLYLTSAFEGANTLSDADIAFDRYGRGAAIEYEDLMNFWLTGGDIAAQAARLAEECRKVIRIL